ncbi:MAG: DoxX family protein [Crocinitomicaceae bacterium]
MNKWIKIVHWIATGLVCLLMTASASIYMLYYEDVAATFEQQLGFPAWLIFPMAVAKFGAVIMLLSKFNKPLTEWAYAGLTFNLLLAVGAHISIQDEQVIQALFALVLVLISYVTWKRSARNASQGE